MVNLKPLVEISQWCGSDPEQVLAGGGNTSYKDAETLWIKASGVSLANIDETGFVEMNRHRLNDLLAADLGDHPIHREEGFKTRVMAARLHPEKGQRPSVECALHNLLPAAYVVHTHPTWVNMVACTVDGENTCRQIYGENVIWVPYVDPGFVLAKTLANKLKDFCARTGETYPEAVVMGNHGLLICGQTPEHVVEVQNRMIQKAKDAIGPLNYDADAPRSDARELIEKIAPALRILLSDNQNAKSVCFNDSPVALHMAMSDKGRDHANGGPLTPDQIVYCKSFPLWLNPVSAANLDSLKEALVKHKTDTGFAPRIIIVEGLGLFAIGDDLAAANTLCSVYLDAIKVMNGAEKLGGIRYMDKREREFIDSWEVENYRRSIAAGQQSKGRAAGKTVLVTGAAQGFGYGIAESLIHDGAHVIVADINSEGVQSAVEKLGPRAIGVAMDVTNIDSVRDAIHDAIRQVGGFDALISNAGVLKAESVKTQPTKDFEFVTRVNYVGYFVMVQACAPILATVRQCDPTRWTDIVQINSKSGLEGSNRNSAYAGSKFGGIGLTQSFALELVEDGIKVNSICPGNFFDGPLWSDPDKGLFAQYLHTGKVPGAQTIGDVKRYYEAKVPMGRGCTPEDVMKAVYYIFEQEYETGQALPVTGGQVMLN
jgi:rhamnose utilization protein RhaD (predicted bifunctional aldolase and dehydrogenase)/NAD(P)-dependent dehydrogenase (short-subunit alcohol dehydrogenase family)